MMHNMMDWGAMWGTGMMLFMIIFWGAVLALVIVGIVYLFRLLQASGGERMRGQETPLDILQKRYASGEIDKKEFEEKKKDLS